MKKWEDVLEIGPQCHERFLSVEKIPELSGIGIHIAGVSNLAGHYKVGNKGFDAHTLIYSVEGTGLLKSPVGQFEMGASTLTILPAYEPYLFEISSERWTTAWICLDDIERWSLLHDGGSRVLHCAQCPSLFHVMSLLYFEERASMRQGIFRQLILYLEQTLLGSNEKVNKTNRLDELFKTIEQQLHYPWTIDEMASRAHYSAPHLHRLCLQAFGRSPIQQLIHLRMKRAAHLLESSLWTIGQIANAVGYHDAFNFSNRFKKSMGVSPSAYRKKSGSSKS